MAAIVGIISRRGLIIKTFVEVETNLTRISQHCVSHELTLTVI